MSSRSASSLRCLASVCPGGAEDGVGSSNGSVSGSATATEDDELALGTGYRLPPPEIKDIVDAPPVPALSFSPHRDKTLFLKRRALPPLADLARPEEKLAGVRIETGVARPLFKSQDLYLNAIFESFVWIDNSTLLEDMGWLKKTVDENFPRKPNTSGTPLLLEDSPTIKTEK